MKLCSRWQRSPFDPSKPHSRRTVVQELDTGFFQGLLQLAQCFGVAAGMPIFEPRNRHWSDLGETGEFSHRDVEKKSA
jgi:hypothetical protein